jgi:hypothetical protein
VFLLLLVHSSKIERKQDEEAGAPGVRPCVPALRRKDTAE